MRKFLWLTVASLIAASCNDSSGPKGPAAGAAVRLIGGFGVSDTITARPTTALIVEVHDSTGAIAPQGTVVRFTGVPGAKGVPEMLVESLSSTVFAPFASGGTDAAGRAGVLVQFGTVAGPARIAISVPTLGVQDTARYTVQPGNISRILLAPADTAVYVGRTFTMRGGVVDRFDNVRTDPVTYTASAPGVSVTGAGVVTASAIGRYRVTGKAGSLSGSSDVSVVPQGTLTAVYNGPSGLRIIAVGLDGSGFRDLTGVSDGGIGPKPRWIPGTNTIIYSHYDGTYQVLRTVDQDGKVATLFPDRPATMTHQAEPSPSASAPVLYFSAYDTRCGPDFYCLHRSGIDGANPELLGTFIAPLQVSWRPSASPDGSKVAFVNAGPIIRVFDYATKTVSAWSVPGQYPSWSPDGSRIAYITQFGGPLRVINADGTNARVIGSTTRLYGEGPITWTADSKWLLARYDGWELIEVETGNTIPLPFTSAYSNGSLK